MATLTHRSGAMTQYKGGSDLRALVAELDDPEDAEPTAEAADVPADEDVDADADDANDPEDSDDASEAPAPAASADDTEEDDGDDEDEKPS